MGRAKDQLDLQQDVGDGWSIQIPAGTWHNVINTGDEPLRVYAIYAPVHHAPGLVQETSTDAERDESTGVDEPPEWTVQPSDDAPDQHAN
jgi:oxalate decarboxylase/phosphoglucose isomerase-like protein (cupin superfamily)